MKWATVKITVFLKHVIIQKHRLIIEIKKKKISAEYENGGTDGSSAARAAGAAGDTTNTPRTIAAG